MEEIFIIETKSDDFETSNQIEGFTLTEEEAILVTENNNKLFNECISLDNKLREKISVFEKEYDKSFPLETRKEFKKWPSGIGEKDITPEMKAERDAIQEENKLIDERNR